MVVACGLGDPLPVCTIILLHLQAPESYKNVTDVVDTCEFLLGLYIIFFTGCVYMDVTQAMKLGLVRRP